MSTVYQKRVNLNSLSRVVAYPLLRVEKKGGEKEKKES
jgi:hypothetical protein